MFLQSDKLPTVLQSPVFKNMVMSIKSCGQSIEKTSDHTALKRYPVMYVQTQCSPFITLCLRSIVMDHVIVNHVIKGQFYKEIL